MRCLFAAAMAAFLLAPGLARAGDYAPLDCGKAKSPAEKAICGSYALGQDEARMATLYAIATSLVAMGQRGDMQGAQRDWLQTRENCGDQRRLSEDRLRHAHQGSQRDHSCHRLARPVLINSIARTSRRAPTAPLSGVAGSVDRPLAGSMANCGLLHHPFG